MYSQANLDVVSMRARREMGRAILILGAGLLLAVIALVIRNRALGMVGLIVFAIVAYGYYALFAQPQIAYRRFLTELLTGLTHEDEGWFESVDLSARQSEEGVPVRGVTLMESKKNKRVALYYWDDRFTFPDIQPGRKLRVLTYGRYIRDLTTLDEDQKLPD